jgi:hypothetical protein
MQGKLGSVFSSSGNSTIGQSSFVKVLKMLKALRLIRLMKLLRIAKLSALLARYQDHFFLFAPILAMAKQMAILVFLGHLAGCCFFFFSTDSWHTRVEQAMIAADDLTTWTRAERFTHELYLPAVKQPIAETFTTEWVPAADKGGAWVTSDGEQLYCPKWYVAYKQTGTWMCSSVQGFFPRYVASLYWVRPQLLPYVIANQACNLLLPMPLSCVDHVRMQCLHHSSAGRQTESTCIADASRFYRRSRL